MGGRPTANGINTFGFPWCPFGRAPDVELMENEFPLLIPLSQQWQDSAGAGKHRGGVGSVQLWVAHHVPMVFFAAIADNSKIQTPQPLFGGYAPATVPGISVRNPDLVKRLREDPGSVDLDFRTIIEQRAIDGAWETEFMGRAVRPYSEDDVITFGFSAGGAGYGDPLEADPHNVVQDYLDGLISEWTMREIYKVAYNAATRKPNVEETERLRSAERRARLERGKSWDEFQAEWSQMKPAEELLKAFGSWPDAAPGAPVMRM
jgi:N-methylhydantoinase B/oxoprolinase/acetone carboxylase alpha subunit